MEIYDFPYIVSNNPNWLSYFSEGLKPPTSIYIYKANSPVIELEVSWNGGVPLNHDVYIYIRYIYIYLVASLRSHLKSNKMR